MSLIECWIETVSLHTMSELKKNDQLSKIWKLLKHFQKYTTKYCEKLCTSQTES